MGGTLPPADGPPVLLRIEGETVTHEPLPDGLPDGVLLFKVWGTSPEDVWVVGEHGVQLHFDGETWTYEPLEGAPRLVTLHGDGESLRVAVGGTNNATLLEDTGDGWVDRSPPLSPSLNGAFVGSQRAAAVGMLGAVHLREGGDWAPLAPLPLFVDLHATWLDGRDDIYVAGGGLLSVTAMDRGALLRWGPARDDLPTGPITLHHPAGGPAQPDVVDGAADVDSAGTSEVGPSPDGGTEDAGGLQDVGPQDASWVVDAVLSGGDALQADGDGEGHLDDVDDTLEVTSSDEVLEADASTAVNAAEVTEADVALEVDADGAALTDVGSDGASVVEAADVTSPAEVSGPEVAVEDVEGPVGLQVEIGEVTTDLSFTPLVTGQLLEIVQGPQGGVHIEVGVRVSVALGSGTALASVHAVSFIEGEAVGDMSLSGYTLYETNAGYVSWAIPVIFYTNLADPYVDATLAISITVTLEDGSNGTGTSEVSLVDWY